LVGWNADEGTLFAARVTFPANAPSYADRIRAQFKDQAAQVLKLYPPGSTPDEDKAAFALLFGDEIIGYGGWAWAERAAATGKAPVYRYHFTRRPPGAPLSSISPLTAPGVYHSAELYYVFNTLGVRDWPWETDDRHLADAMSSYWANFAKTGDPNGPGLPQWSAYQPNGGGQAMELGKEIGMRGEQHRDRYEFFDALYGKLTSQ
jgi:para-nitrobenzyl esterase